MTTNTDIRKLSSLNDWQLEDDDQDLRGKTLFDLRSNKVGRIDDMLADTEGERIVALRLDDDRIVNIDNVDIRDGQPVLTVDAGHLPLPAADFDREALTSEHIPIVEESIDIGRRRVDLGTVRVRIRVVSDTVDEEVTLRDERVRVESRPASKVISASDADALLQDSTIELIETGERVVAEKRATITGEVVVKKGIEERTARVGGVVRRTEVDVDRDIPEDK